MIDNVCVKIESFEHKEWSQFRNLIEEANFTISPSGLREYLDWSNLRITYHPNEKELWIKNSLHKFFNNEVREISISDCNYNDFTFENLKNTLECLSYHFYRPLNDFQLFGKVEYGVNISVVPYSPMKIIDSYLSLSNTGNNLFYPMIPSQGRVYGKKSYFTEYSFKVYDKSKQAEIPINGIMRLECQCRVTRIKKKLKISQFTFLDLTNEKYVEFIKNDFLNCYNNILKTPIEQTINREELMGMLMISSPQGIDFDKREMTTHHYRKNRQKYRTIMREYSDDPKSIHYWVKSKIDLKLGILTS